MAQDPEGTNEPERSDSVNRSHDLDMVTLRDFRDVDAEMRADVIRGVLESNGVPAMIVGAPQYPVLGFALRVPRTMVDEAERLIAEAEAAGPDAAVEAEALSEEGQ